MHVTGLVGEVHLKKLLKNYKVKVIEYNSHRKIVWKKIKYQGLFFPDSNLIVLDSNFAGFHFLIGSLVLVQNNIDVSDLNVY